MELFCPLAREQVVTSLRQGKRSVVEKCRNSTVGFWNRLQYKDKARRGGSHRMMSVERVNNKHCLSSSEKKTSVGNGGRSTNFRPSWIDRFLLQRFISSQRKRTSRPSTSRNQPMSPTINNNDNSYPSRPILIRKNPRRE